jgi:hypothetical protein
MLGKPPNKTLQQWGPGILAIRGIPVLRPAPLLNLVVRCR